MEEKVIVTQGRYVASAVKKEQYPRGGLPEIVFIGRSNVGKSSLINSLTRVKNLALPFGQFTAGPRHIVNPYKRSPFHGRPAILFLSFYLFSRL